MEKKYEMFVSVLVLLFSVNTFAKIYPYENLFLVGVLSSIAISIASVAIGYYALKFQDTKSFHSKALFSLLFCMTANIIGSIIWIIQSNFFGLTIPSILSNIFWALAYPFMFAGLYYVWKILSLPEISRRVVGIVGILSIITLYIISYLLPFLMNSSTQVFILASLVILDILALDFLLMIIVVSSGGKMTRIWSILILSILLLTIGNMYYMYFSYVKIDNLIDTLFNISNVLLAAGFLYNRYIMEHDVKKLASRGKK